MTVPLLFQLARHAEDQRQQHHKTDLEKHRDADDECREGHGPGQHVVGRPAEDRVGDRLGDPGIGQYLAEHGAEGDDDSHDTQGVAGAGHRGPGDRADIHPGGDADGEGDHKQCDQWMQPNAGDDKRHQQRHTAERGQQQLDIGFGQIRPSPSSIRACRLLIDPTDDALREVGGGCLAAQIRRADPVLA